MELDSDIQVDYADGSFEWTGNTYTITFNEEFLSLDDAQKLGLIHYWIATIQAGGMLWRAAFTALAQAKAIPKTPQGEQVVARYLTYLTRSAIANCSCESVEGAAQMEALYAYYDKENPSQTESYFYQTLPARRALAKKVHLLMRIEEQRKQS